MSPEPRPLPVRSLAGLDREACDDLVRDLGEPPYRAGQLFAWVHKHGAPSYDAMTSLSKTLRAKLGERLPVRSTKVAARHPSDDGTVKLLIGLEDGETVECVLIPEGERLTACISTQVGCGVGCTFCASGADGVIRNLDASEIVEQVLWLTAEAGQRLTNIVVMGMGEPLHNVDALVAALRILQHPEGVDLGSRRITVSTSGPTRGFADFLASGVKVKLAISLHAARDDLRRELVPRGGSGSVAQLRRMARDWFERTGRDVTYEYVLLDSINDSDRDADVLADLCDRHTNVNLIPMNPVPFAPALRAPPPARSERFAARLTAKGVTVHLRRQRGDDVAAACGQLRLASRGEAGEV